MATQYDKIGASYAAMHKMPSHRLIEPNIQAAIKPVAAGAKILDLACGMGRYARPMVSEWGADYVLGVDISSSMIEEARRHATGDQYRGKVEFEVGDCSKPHQYPQGPFDVVFGSWFLNYAADYATQLEMWRNIAINISPHGVFVGVTLHATDDPKGYTLQVQKERPPVKGATATQMVEEVEDGCKNRIIAGVEPQNVIFDQYHLKKSVYERAAREAGMTGDFDWRVFTVPDEMKDDSVISGWESYARYPPCSVLVVRKC